MELADFARTQLPPVALVTQHLLPDHIPDVRQHTCRCLLEAGLRDKVGVGMRIAITAGSRGMGGFLELLCGIVDAVKEAGGEPFIVPAMGSHGGATGEGQTAILQGLNVTESSVGAPILACMETVTLGTAENGAVVHLDRNAAEADGIIVLGRYQFADGDRAAQHDARGADAACALF